MVRLLAFLVCLSSVLFAQTSPFLPGDLYNKLVNEISGERSYDHLRTLTQYHAPNGASRGFKAEALWIAEQARQAGLADVVVHELPYHGVGWTPLSAELWLLETGKDGQTHETRLASYAEVATSIADYSRPAKLEAELVDVGEGVLDRDYEGKDVKGKVVLASGALTEVEKQAVWKRGALGIVSYYTTRINAADYPDQVPWLRVHSKPDKETGKEPAWAVVVSWRKGNELRRRLNPRREHDPFSDEPKEVPADQLRVRVAIESEFVPNPTQGLVEGWIRGRRHDQQVVLTAHVQEEKFSANDDRSGCANLLEIARALNQLVREGKLPQLERDLRFWWANEIGAEYQWFAEHPDDRKNIFVNINQDMVGAHQTIGGLSRVQQVTRTPWSRPTFFNDVVESIVSALYHGNNAYIAARQAQTVAPGSPYTRPIYSRLGTRDRYSVEIVPYFDSTDHMVFNDAFIGTTHGGITFTNWPDEHIHSSDDDLWQMDRTVLKRNAVAVTALAWFMGNAGSKDAQTLGGIMVNNAIARIVRDLAVAASNTGAEGRTVESMRVRAAAVEREQQALLSLRSLAPGDEALRKSTAKWASIVDSITPRIETAAEPPAPLAMQRIPVRTEDLAAYVKILAERFGGPGVPGLHPLMRYEALNFADGKRTIWDIYEAVRAESLATGEWYYGRVTPEMVEQFFTKAAEAGIITLKEAPPRVPATPKKKRNR